MSKLKDKEKTLQSTDINNNRQSQIGNMGRGSRIRTYNFIEDRVKNERIQKKFRTKDIMNGKLDLIYNNIN